MEERTWGDVPAYVWLQISTVAVLFVALHWGIIHRMIEVAKREPDWSHAFLIPFISLFFVHTRRQPILNTPVQRCWWGFPIFVAAFAAYLLSIFPVKSPMFQGYTMIAELFGIVLFLGGWRIMKIVWFPILYLGFGIEFSTKLWRFIAWKLQMFSARSAVDMMNILGLDAEVRGATIELWNKYDYLGALNVAEACSGLRMLIAFIALGAAVVYVFDRPWWSRGLLLALTIPIAVTVNALRVTIVGLLHLVNPELSAGDFHLFIGMLMVIPAMGLFLLIGWILDHLIIHEEPVQNS